MTGIFLSQFHILYARPPTIGATAYPYLNQLLQYYI